MNQLQNKSFCYYSSMTDKNFSRFFADIYRLQLWDNRFSEREEFFKKLNEIFIITSISVLRKKMTVDQSLRKSVTIEWCEYDQSSEWPSNNTVTKMILLFWNSKYIAEYLFGY